MRKTIGGIAILRDGAQLRSSTTLERGGPYSVVIASVVSTVDVELHSTYVGHPAVDTRAVHLELRRRGPARVSTAASPHAALPVTHAHERLTLDHLAQLRELVADAGGGHITIELDDAAFTGQ